MKTESCMFSKKEFGDALIYFLIGPLYQAYKIAHASIELEKGFLVNGGMKKMKYEKGEKPHMRENAIFHLTRNDIKNALLEYVSFSTCSLQDPEKFLVTEILTEIPEKIAVELCLPDFIEDKSQGPREHVFDSTLKL